MERAEFLANRIKGVGSSDIASLYSLPPYGCRRRLGYEKIGEKPDHPFHGNKQTERGNALEPIAAEQYSIKTGLELTAPGQLIHPEHPELRGHPDRFVRYQENVSKVLEIKCPSRDSFYRMKQTALPDAYNLQLQYIVGLTRDCGDRLANGEFVILCADLWELEVVPTAFNEQIYKTICSDALAFWKATHNGVLADPLPDDDPRCVECPYRGTCKGKQAEQLLAELPELVKVPAVYDPHLAPLVRMHNELKAQGKFTELAVVDDQIAAAMGNRVQAMTDGAFVSYRPQERRTVQVKPLVDANRQYARVARQLLDSGQIMEDEVAVFLNKIATLPFLIDNHFTNRTISRPLKITSTEEEAA